MNKFTSRRAEEVRLRALYRRAAMRGELKGLTLGAIRSLVGPDCAYHLYGSLESSPQSKELKNSR